jgi:ketosteroid isomerase-like protein
MLARPRRIRQQVARRARHLDPAWKPRGEDVGVREIASEELSPDAVGRRRPAAYFSRQATVNIPPDPMSSTTGECADPTRALVDRYLAAYNAFDVPGMLALLHPDVTFENVSAGQVTASARGAAEFRALAEHAATLFTERQQTVRAYRATVDPAGAVVDIDYVGVLAVDLGPELRAGQTLQLTGRSTFHVRDGRLVRIVDES